MERGTEPSAGRSKLQGRLRKRYDSGRDFLEPDPGARAAAMVAERFEAVDDARMRELDRLIRRGYANTDPSDIPGDELDAPSAPPPAAHPQPGAGPRTPSPAAIVERHRVELERKRAELARALLGPPRPAPAAAAPPRTQETTMACPECKSPTMHKHTCSRRPGGPNGRPLKPAEKAAAAPARKEARPRPPRRGKVGAGVLDQVEALRDQARTRLDEIAAELDALEADRSLLSNEAVELRRFLGVDGAGELTRAAG